MIKSKKLSSLVAASLILTGGSFLGVQTVSADDSTRLAAVEALASQNHDSISELKETVKNISTTPEQLQQIAANKTDIAANKDAINKEVQERTKAVADEAKARGDKDTEHDTAIAANKKAIEDEATARDKADQQEAQTRAAEDTRLNTKMDKGFADIQGQQDEQDAKIGKNQKDIQTNAGNIQKNKDAIKVNSDKIANHEERITTNESYIVHNAEAIKKETNARIDEDKKLQGNIDAEATARDAADKAEAKARADKDTAHDTAIAANKKAIGDEAAARQADVSRLDNKIHDVSKEVDTVGALSMAMSGLHPLSYDEGDARFQLSAAVGTYDGTEALALGGFYHFNRDSMLSVGVATDLGADEHRMGANVGYTRRIGQGGHVSRPSEGTVSDIMKDIKNLEQKQAKLEQENEQLKQQLAALNK